MQKYSYNIKTIYGNPVYRTGHFGVNYRGINYVKCPFDYVIYQMIIEEVKPDLIIEIGTYLGGGALYLADILDKIGNGVVHTIDIVNREYDQKVLNHPRIKMFSDGYQGYDLKSTTGFNKVMIVDDGSHVYIDVIEAFEKFKNLVNRDSYYIIEDGIVGYDEPNFYGGPHKAIMNIVSNNNEFFVDRRWCDFFGENATFNPDGYLKRK